MWVSTTFARIEYDGQSPGEHWELVGTINTNQERDFYTYIQILLGLRQTTRGRPEFYLDGDPVSSWVQATHRMPFWVAIDPWGEMRPHIHGARPTYFVSTGQAVVTQLTRRAPEPHPGLAVKPVKVPIRLKRTNGEVFAKWEKTDA
ncbi:hypothetical protein W7U_00035 [Mycobacterium sp. H4Y]|nr:hypothetical protein W7U_00035 [Mycobacterium sp. H4Y]